MRYKEGRDTVFGARVLISATPSFEHLKKYASEPNTK